MMRYKISILFSFIFAIINSIVSAPAQPFVYKQTGGIKSDVIVTKWNPNTEKTSLNNINEEDQPGWMRKQLISFGKVASKVGNMMGSHATKISAALDKICEVIKTLIPLLAAICHVGQFGFCAATNEAPVQLAAAISPSMLTELDR